MTFDPSGIFNTAIGAVVGTIVGACMQALRKDALKAEVKQLKDQRIVGLETAVEEGFDALETKLDKHISNDQSQAVMTKLDELGKKMSRVEDKMDATREDVASLKTNRDRDREFIDNVNGALQSHKREPHR